MSKKEAIAAMSFGNWVTHALYKDDNLSFTYNAKKRKVITNEGVEISAPSFWLNRQGETWNNNWKLIK